MVFLRKIPTKWHRLAGLGLDVAEVFHLVAAVRSGADGVVAVEVAATLVAAGLKFPRLEAQPFGHLQKEIKLRRKRWPADHHAPIGQATRAPLL